MSLEWILCLSPRKWWRGQTSHNLLGGQLLVPISSPLILETMSSSTQGTVTDFHQPVRRAWSDGVTHTEVKAQTRRLHLKHAKHIYSVIYPNTNCVTLSNLYAGFAASDPTACGGGDLRLVPRRGPLMLRLTVLVNYAVCGFFFFCLKLPNVNVTNIRMAASFTLNVREIWLPQLWIQLYTIRTSLLVHYCR